MIDHTDELAGSSCASTASRSPTRGEVAYAAEFFRWNAEETVRIRGSMGTAPSGTNRIVVHHPPSASS
jgi:succinate-semialdehyde dehydrogenase / glutarate-semialdehyde dehydrogenase